MENNITEKPKRVRRTNQEIEKSLTSALKKVIGKKGFSNITLAEIAKQAKVEPPVIYNKYGNLQGLLNNFAKRYEYWLNEILDRHVDDFYKGNHQKFLSELLQEIANRLYDDKVMQKLLIWEVLEKNKITKKSAIMREKNTYSFANFYENHFKTVDIDFNAFASLIISGTYYLVLHKDSSTFCTIDYNSNEGKELLLKTIDKLLCWIFDELTPDRKMLEAARKMKKDGMNSSQIAKYTGLSIENIDSLND